MEKKVAAGRNNSFNVYKSNWQSKVMLKNRSLSMNQRYGFQRNHDLLGPMGPRDQPGHQCKRD